MLLYAVSRFVIEMFRGDPRGVVLGVLSTSQFISVVLAPLSIVMLIVLSRRPGEATPGPVPAKRRAGRA
jgi:phosphatidylglycerol:prolipoprotein diacylglycerol transferase